MKRSSIIITCEHATNRVPRKLVGVIDDTTILATHWAYDIGALQMARIIAQTLGVSLLYTTVTRLIVDCNRSIGSDELFSKFVKDSNIFLKNEIVKRYYTTYRSKIETTVSTMMQNSDLVFHISVHSFTPQLNGFKRYADIGLLYDQYRPVESIFCSKIKEHIVQLYPLRVAFNYPFRGCGDGVTVWLRKLYGESYCGIELEVNQEIYFRSKRMWTKVAGCIAHAIEYAANSILLLTNGTIKRSFQAHEERGFSF
ncbi:MAG: N-formylglutamate amidohydrolase [Spirochaetes bacterium]|nr:N-formylglutamate amidohydrolase [Spirochaetota bacterium]